MIQLSAEKLSKSYNQRVLFEDLTLGLHQGEKVALIGPNGQGKSTLMKIMAGLEVPDTGQVSPRKGIKISYLPQVPTFAEGVTIGEAIFAVNSPQAIAAKAYLMALESGDGGDMENALVLMEDAQAWDFETRAAEVLGRLHLHDLKQACQSLSGGQRKRVALAQMVLSDPDLLLLDEPTNHLDIEAIEWLEGYLSSSNTTLLLVTHDRYFLDRVCNTIWEMEKSKIFVHPGKYDLFLERKAEREAIQQTDIDKAKQLMLKELEWLRRQPKARGTKAKYRVDAFDGIKEKASQKINRDKIQLDVAVSRQGNQVIEIEKLSKRLSEKILLDNFSYVFRKGDRIGLFGPNGIGKTTFLNLVTNAMPADAGNVIIGQTTKIGYYKQEEMPGDPEARVIEEVRKIAEFVTLSNGDQISVGKLLERFLFSPQRQYTPIGLLSGGERRRLQLLKMLVAAPNFLILDEPTNDLDIPSLNVLEDFLESFSGCLIIVSHDRYFLDKLCDHLFVFEGEGKIKDFPGNYTDYVAYKEELEQQAKNPSAKTEKKAEPKPAEVAPKQEAIPSASKSSKKLSFKEKREFEELETAIPSMEKERDQLLNKLSSEELNNQQRQELTQKLEATIAKLEEAELRWLELSEMV